MEDEGLLQSSLSTMWAIGHYERLADFARRAAELGFTHVELNYQITPGMMEEALAGLALPVSSLHAPAPVRSHSNGRPSYDCSLTALERDEREAAVRWTEETLDYASRLGARGVVVHLGWIPVGYDLQAQLRGLYNRGLAASADYAEIKARLLAQRQAAREPYLEAARWSLRRIAARAAAVGVPVGLEVRYFLYEMPDFAEMAELLADYDGSVGYWHDVGHAENQARLGFVAHEAWLERFGPRLVGVHLHDVEGLADHRAAGKGDLDLAMVARLLPPAAIRVCEFAPFNTEEEVCRGRELLADKGVLRKA